MAPVVEVSSSDKFGGLRDEIIQALTRALVYLKIDNFAVEVCLVTDEVMQGINKRFQSKDEPASVLSFGEVDDMPLIPQELKPLGEIYLAPDFIERQNQNVVQLALHGFLHLIGYTHNGKSDTIEMKKIEHELWRMLLQDLI